MAKRGTLRLKQQTLRDVIGYIRTISTYPQTEDSTQVLQLLEGLKSILQSAIDPESSHICSNASCGQEFQSQKALLRHKQVCNGKQLQKTIAHQQKLNFGKLPVVEETPVVVAAPIYEQITIECESDEELVLEVVAPVEVVYTLEQLQAICATQEAENKIIIQALKEEINSLPKIKSYKQMQAEKKQQKKASKLADKECFSELKRMAKVFLKVVKIEKKEQKKRDSAAKKAQNKMDSIVLKTLPSLAKMFGAKKTKKVAAPKAKKIIIVSEKQVDTLCQDALEQVLSVLNVQDMKSCAPVYEQIILECESTEESEIMVASSDHTDDDNNDDGDHEQTTVDVITTEEQEAVKVYETHVKQSSVVKVCGRNKMTVVPKKNATNLVSFPENKKTFVLMKGQITYNILRRELLNTIDELKIITQGEKNLQVAAHSKIRSALTKFNNGKNMRIEYGFKIDSKDIWKSTKVNSFNNAITALIRCFKEDSEQYGFDPKDLGLAVVQYNERTSTTMQQKVRGGRLIIDMNSQYLIVSPNSDTNCFYQCLVYHMLVKDTKKVLPYWQLSSESQENASEWIVMMSKKLKAQTGNKKDHSDKSDVQDICNYYGTTITVYDNLFNIHKDIGTLKPVNFKKDRKSSPIIGENIKVQFSNGHCLLLVSRKQNPEFCSTFVTPKKEIEFMSVCEPIKVRKTKVSDQVRHIMTFDIESYKLTSQCGTQIPFAIGLCTDFDVATKEYQYQQFYSENCLTEFLDFISDLKVPEPEIYIYAHNGAKYDLHIINEQLLRRTDFYVSKKDFVSLNGAVISQKVVNSKGQIIVFRDSARIFAGKLDDLCKDLKPHYMKKSKHDFNFDDLNKSNVFVEGEMKDEIALYLKHDCLSLVEIMITFRQQLLKDPKIEIDICDCFTSATLAKKLFFTKYYWRYCNPWRNGVQVKDYIYEVTKDIDTYIRNSYFGGRCDIYGYGKFQNVYYYDFTSLYPSVGANKMYPFGKPVFVDGSDIVVHDFFGFIRCKVYTNDAVIPLHGFKQDSKLTFAHHIGTEMTLFSEELKYGIDLGYKYEILDGYRYQKSPILSGIMKDGFENKAQAKKDKQPVMEKTWKIMINSAYGFWGLRWQDKRGVQFLDGQQLDQYLDEGKVYNYTQIQDDQYMVDIEQDLKIKGKSIAIASACTSYARMELYSAMNAITQKGFKIHYTDTDSIITDCDISKHEDLMKRFMWDGCGAELGALKNEALDYCKKKLTPENLQKQQELDGGELSFDECQILGPKMYSLKKTLVDGQVIEICKMKGMKDSTYESQSNLLSGGVLSQSVTQFKSGKNLYLMDQDIQGRVKVVEQIKNVMLYEMENNEVTNKHKYSKGYIVGQNVLPFTFENGVLIE